MILLGLFTLLMGIALSSSLITSILFNRITIILLFYSIYLSYNVLNGIYQYNEIGIYGNLFHVTTLSQSFDTFILLLGGIILLLNEYPYRTSKKNDNVSLYYLPILSEYPLIVLFTLLGGILLLSSNDLVSMYLSIELQSFAVYILASIYRESESSTSAGLKYFLLGGLSSGFILLGSSLVYGFSGITQFDNLYIFSLVNSNIISTIDTSFYENFNYYNNYMSMTIIQLSILIITIGFLFKIASAPFHNWAPDVYDGVPTIVTTWLSVIPKISILIFLLTLHMKTGMHLDILNLTFSSLGADSSSLMKYLNTVQLSSALFILSATLSLIIGTLLGLAQYKIKRLLAYSTISHVGFMLLGLSVLTEESIEAFLFYIIQYSLTNLNVFFIILAFGYILQKESDNHLITKINATQYEYNKKYGLIKEYTFYSPISTLSHLRNQYASNALLVLSFAVCLFSMAGIPPLVGFFAKQMILYASMHEGYIFVSVIAIITSVISASYYLKIVKIMYFDKHTTYIEPIMDNTSVEYNNTISINYLHSFIIACITLFILFFVVNPNIILNSVHLLTLNIFYF